MSKIEKLKAELLRAKEKASEWQARARDLERQITEQENLEILQVVRGLLDMIRASYSPNMNSQEGQEHEK